MGVIYKITNKKNGKIYIGKRIWNSEKFMTSSYYGSGIYIKRTINKIGKNNFNREIIEEINDPKILSERERYWISYYKSNQRELGYNLSEGGENLPGFHHSEETRQKIGKSNAIALIGNIVSEETRRKIGNFFRGRLLTSEHKNKISMALTDVPKTEEHILHNKLSKIGKKHTDNHNAKIKDSMKKWHKNKGFSDDAIKKMKTHASQRFSNLEERQKMSQRMNGHVVSDETRRKISETLKNKHDKNLTNSENIV